MIEQQLLEVCYICRRCTNYRGHTGEPQHYVTSQNKVPGNMQFKEHKIYSKCDKI